MQDESRLNHLIQQADAEANAQLENSELRGLDGFCHTFWDLKKKILREKYGIDWASPSDMDPLSCFD